MSAAAKRTPAKPKSFAPLVTAVADITKMFISARVKVSASGAETEGIPDNLQREVRLLKDAMRQSDEQFEQANFAHYLALTCAGNVRQATVEIEFEGQIDDNGFGYTNSTVRIDFELPGDGLPEAMGSFNCEQLEEHISCGCDLDFLDKNDTKFVISKALTEKLFEDGDYAAFLAAAQRVET